MAEMIREKIITEALREINCRGADFHMDDLARNLRISKRTLYEHFSSKQEIIETSMLTVLDDIYEQHTALIADTSLTAEEKLISFFKVRLRSVDVLSVRKTDELLSKMPEVCETLNRQQRKDWDLLRNILLQARKDDEFQDFDVNLVFHMLYSAAADMIEYFDDVEHDYSFPEYMEKCVRIILCGIKRQEAIHQ